MNRMQRVVADDGGAVGAAPGHVVAEVGVVGLRVTRVDAGLQFGDELVDGIACGLYPCGIA